MSIKISFDHSFSLLFGQYYLSSCQHQLCPLFCPWYKPWKNHQFKAWITIESTSAPSLFPKILVWYITLILSNDSKFLFCLFNWKPNFPAINFFGKLFVSLQKYSAFKNFGPTTSIWSFFEVFGVKFSAKKSIFQNCPLNEPEGWAGKAILKKSIFWPKISLKNLKKWPNWGSRTRIFERTVLSPRIASL